MVLPEDSATIRRRTKKAEAAAVAAAEHVKKFGVCMVPFRMALLFSGECWLVDEIQTHKRFKRTLFIRTKHNMQIFRVIPFIKLQNDT